MDIREKFQETFKKAVKVQEETQDPKRVGPAPNGKDVWKTIEAPVENIELPEDMEYRHDKLDTIYKEMDEIDKKYDMSSHENDPIYNHFFLQLKNLVVKKSNFVVKVNRILQLAFNAGQLSVFIKNKKLPQEMLSEISTLIEKYNMNDIETYLSPADIEKINKILNKKSMTGGNQNYYQKYLKYKQKYYELRYKKY